MAWRTRLSKAEAGKRPVFNRMPMCIRAKSVRGHVGKPYGWLLMWRLTDQDLACVRPGAGRFRGVR